MAAISEKKLIQELSRSKIFEDYERAFNEATGMPLSLRSVQVWNMAHRGKKFENPFCALMAGTNRTCVACLETQQQISDPNADGPKTVVCFAGLCDTTVPLRVGNDLVGFLQTGQVAVNKPTKAKFNKMAKQLVDWGIQIDLKKLEETYFQSRVLTKGQYESMVRLLSIFSQHLSMVANQIVIQRENSEPPMVTKARQYIQEKKSEDLSLADVARAVNVSTFYFCKMFKKATGLNFTEYLSRVRIEKAKNLLLNPNLRVSEIAYDVGFQSLTHFNRVFRKIQGLSPTDYRRSLKVESGSHAS